MNPTLRACLLQTVLAAAIAGAALAAYDHLVLRPALRIGVVDVAEVYRAKEAEFTRLLARQTSDEERQQALGLAGQFARRLPSALEELSTECACLVLIRAAIAGSPARAVDMTTRLRAKLETP